MDFLSRALHATGPSYIILDLEAQISASLYVHGPEGEKAKPNLSIMNLHNGALSREEFAARERGLSRVLRWLTMT